MRNGERFLQEALASIQAQTYSRWTLVLVDDGSSDGTTEVARAFAETESRCRLFIRPPTGRLEALRFAHAQTRTEFVAWVDGDDRLHPSALEVCLRTMDDAPWAVMAFTQRASIGEGGESRPERRRLRPTGTNLLRSFSTFHFRLIRTAAFEAVGGIGHHPIGIDYDLCLRLWEHGPVAAIDEVLYDYRRHRAQMSTATRAAQVEASARAVREAIVRRGLDDAIALSLQGHRPKFEIRRAAPAATGIRASITRRQTPPRVAVVWPHRGRHLDVLVEESLHAHGLGVVPTPGTLDALAAADCPDVLVLRDWGHTVRTTAERGRLLGVLTRLRAAGCRIVSCAVTGRSDDTGMVEALCHDVLDCALPPSPVGLVPARDRSRARARMGIDDDETVMLYERAPPSTVPTDAAVLVFAQSAGVGRPIAPGRDARLDAIAAADVVIFDDPAAVAGDLWCETIAAGRAVQVCGRRRDALRKTFGGSPLWLEDSPQALDRKTLRERGLQLRERMRTLELEAFGRRIIGAPRGGLLRSAWRRASR